MNDAEFNEWYEEIINKIDLLERNRKTTFRLGFLAWMLMFIAYLVMLIKYLFGG